MTSEHAIAQPAAARARGSHRLIDVALVGPGSYQIGTLLDGAPSIRRMTILERTPPAGLAGVIVLVIDPRRTMPAVDRHTPIVAVFHGRPATRDAIGLLRAGVTGALVCGEFTRADLLAAIDGARRGDVHLSAGIATSVVGYLRQPFTPPGPRGEPVALSDTDLALLEAITAGKPNVAIAHDLGVATQTVRNRVSALYAKLGVHSRAEATAYWFGSYQSPGNAIS